MKHHLLRVLTFCIGWPLTLVAFFYVGSVVISHGQEVVAQTKTLNWLLLSLGITCYIVYFFIRAWFWQRFLKISGHPLPFSEVSYLWGITEIKRFIPGNIWSFLSRSHVFSKREIKTSTTLSISFIEGLYILVACAIISLWALDFLIYGVFPYLPNQHTFGELIKLAVWAGTILLLFNSHLFRCIPYIKKYIPRMTWQENASLLGISLLSLVLFGLGTYFIISAITILYVAHITTLVGFFVFSLLVGYLSFITPMGLGVREGIITIGLSKYIPLALAGFGAIFARILFIISELLFLGIAYLWYKAKSPFIVRIIHRIIRHRYEILLGTGITLYILYFTTASFARYDNFYAGRFDLGNMEQTVWNTLHGRFFQFTNPDGTQIISRLAFHADFILVLLVPFYALWQDPRMLLLVQTVVLALGSIFVYLIANNALKKKSLGFLFAFAYLINPAIQYSNLYDFHGVTLATTFLLGAFYFERTKKYVWYILFLLLAGISKEQVWIITAFFGLYTTFVSRKRILGTCIFLSSISIAYYLVTYAIPQARGGEHFALEYYSDFGSSPTNIIQNILLSPIKTISVLLGKGQLTYLFHLFAPFGFLSLFSVPFLLFPSADLGLGLLSNNTNLHAIFYQYTATITPFVIIAAIYGFSRVSKRFPLLEKTNYLAWYLLGCSLFSAYTFGPLPGAKSASIAMFVTPPSDKEKIVKFIDSIPPWSKIAATNNAGSRLSQREYIYTIPMGIEEADIILFMLNETPNEAFLKEQALSEKISRDARFIELYRTDYFVAFARKRK